MSSYVLQQRGDPIEMPHPQQPEDDLSGSRILTDHPSADGGRSEVLRLYEHYASLYPNPHLAKERQERDRLLRAATAATHAVKVNSPSSSVKSNKSSFWRKVWPFSSKGEDAIEETKSLEKEVENLIYEEDDPPQDSDLSLCGTQWSLDVSCIPDEAHSVARFHLASMRRYRPNEARTSWEVAGSSIITITGLGELLEFRTKESRFVRQLTSDRDDLHAFVAEHQRDGGQQHPPVFRLEYARAALVGPNLLIVSWGLLDGMVVFYRRLTRESDVAWQARACVGPTGAVRGNLSDLFAEESSFGSPLLRVSDLLPLVVETDHAPAATLAVSRLGGFLELVPLPPGMWYGPELPPPEVQRRKKRKRGEHYAVNLVDLATVHRHPQQSTITSLTTTQYHRDIICLDCLRTRVEDNTELNWDEDAYPSAPPSEHVLVAVGMSEGGEVASFWSIGTILSGVQQDNGSAGFSVHAAIMEAIQLGFVGPDVTLFASDVIKNQWRRPRELHLRAETDPSIASSSTSSSSTAGNSRVTTISLPVPVTTVRFSSFGGNFLGAVLDWNGGVVFFECGLLERLASQTLNPEEYELLFRNDNHSSAIPLVKIIADRTISSRQLQILGGSALPQVSDVLWLPAKLRSSEASDALVCALTNPPAVAILPIPGAGYDAISVSVPLPDGVFGALLTTRVGELAYLFTGSKTPHDSYALAVLDKLDPRSIVQLLIRESKFKEAMEVASKFLAVDGITEIVEKAKLHHWKESYDFNSLESILDDQVVVREVLTFDSQAEAVVGNDRALELFRSSHELVLLRLSTANPNIVMDSETPVIMRSVKERLVRLGTYQLLCRHLSVHPTFSSFCSDFLLPNSVLNLALLFARSCELGGLSILCFRHAFGPAEICDIVGALPLSMDPYLYHHLLPTYQSRTFLRVLDDEPILTDKQFMPNYLLERFNLSVLDASNAQVAYECDETQTATFELLDVWYTDRLQGIDRVTASIQSSLDFARFGVAAMSNYDAISGIQTPAAERLSKFLRRSYAFQLSLLSLPSPTKDSEQKIFTSNVECFESTSVAELLDLVFRPDQKSDSKSVLDRYQVVFLPLLESLAPTSSSKVNLEGGLSSFCISRIQAFSVEPSSSPHSFLRALELCASVCHLSRCCIPSKSRLIQSKKLLFDTVASIFEIAQTSCSVLNMPEQACPDVLTFLWIMLESLPMRGSVGMDAREGLETLHKFADTMFEQLVITEIVAEWSNWQGFQIVGNLDDGLALAVTKSIALSFCSQIESRLDNGLKKKWIEVLISDVAVLQRLRLFDGESPHIMVAYEVISLLARQSNMEAIDVMLSVLSDDWIDREKVSNSLLAFVNDVVFGDDDSDTSANGLRLAVRCRDIIGTHFPETLAKFQASWRYLEAADFIRNVMLKGRNSTIRPRDVHGQDPLDVIETILNDYPDLIICDCHQWSDPIQAKILNSAQREAVDPKTRSPKNADTGTGVLPGDAVVHLGKVLELRDEADVIVVKSLAIHHGRSVNLFGACAAVARTLLLQSIGLVGIHLESLVLGDVVGLILTNDYEDVPTKNELARYCLTWFSAALKPRTIRPFKGLVHVYRIAELSSFCDPEGQPLPSAHHLHIVQRLISDTAVDYAGTNLAGLFQTLQQQIYGMCVEGSLLVALARFVFYWLIAQSTRQRKYLISSIEEWNAHHISNLASSMLLHVPDTEASKRTLLELKTILEEQLEQNVLCDLNRPACFELNNDLLKRLVGRGYSEFGARRALTMTGNSSFEDALQWAVYHSLDKDFDDPIIYLKPTDHVSIDESGIESLRLALTDTVRLLVRTTAVIAIPAEETESKFASPMNVCTDSAVVRTQTKRAAAEVKDAQQDTGEHTSPTPISKLRKPKGRVISRTIVRKSHEMSAETSKVDQPSPSDGVEQAGRIQGEALRRSLIDERLVSGDRLQTTNVPKRDKVEASQFSLQTANGTTTNPASGAASHVARMNPAVGAARSKLDASATKSPVTKPTPVDTTTHVASPTYRRSLLLKGQAVLNVARKKSSPNVDDRKKLIEAGRRLLQKSRPHQEVGKLSGQDAESLQPLTTNDRRQTASAVSNGAPLATQPTMLTPTTAEQPSRQNTVGGNKSSQGMPSQQLHPSLLPNSNAGKSLPRTATEGIVLSTGIGLNFDELPSHLANAHNGRGSAAHDHTPMPAVLDPGIEDNGTEGWTFDDDVSHALGEDSGRSEIARLHDSGGTEVHRDIDDPPTDEGWNFDDDLT